MVFCRICPISFTRGDIPEARSQMFVNVPGLTCQCRGGWTVLKGNKYSRYPPPPHPQYHSQNINYKWWLFRIWKKKIMLIHVLLAVFNTCRLKLKLGVEISMSNTESVTFFNLLNLLIFFFSFFPSFPPPLIFLSRHHKEILKKQGNFKITLCVILLYVRTQLHIT